QSCDRGQKIAEAFALHDDVLAHALRDKIRVAGDQRIDNPLMLGKRRRESIAYAELQAPVRAQASMQGGRLLGEEGVVTSRVDDVVEMLVLIIVAVRVHGIARALAGAVRLEELLVLGR